MSDQNVGQPPTTTQQPAAPAAPTSPPVPAPPTQPSTAASQPTQQPPAGAQEPQTVDALPDWAQKLIRDTRAEAAGYRTSREQMAAEARDALAQQIGQALGLTSQGGTAPKPEELTAKLEAAQREARIADVTNRAIRAASAKGGIDVDGMLDSVSVTSKLADLDPTSATFETDLAEIVTAAAERYPARSASPPGGKTGPPVTGQPSTGQLTESDLASMTPDQIATALSEGRLKGLL